MITGLTRGTGREHIIRAALESIAFQSNDVIGAMREDAALEIGTLRVDGGASSNNLLMQFQANISDLEVVRPKQKEATAVGAAYLAGRAVGLFDGGAPSGAEVQSVFTPYINESTRQALLDGWRSAVRACRGK